MHTIPHHCSGQASWSASPPSLGLRSPLHLCSSPGCCPRLFLHVLKPARSIPRRSRVAACTSNFVGLFRRLSSSSIATFSSRSDDVCICYSSVFYEANTECLAVECSAADIEAANEIFQEICSAFVHPLSYRTVPKRLRNIDPATSSE